MKNSKRQHPPSRKIPSIRNVISALEMHIGVLLDSFTNRSGPNKGEITELHILREIECFERGIELLKSKERSDVMAPHRITILRALWNYDTQASRQAYEVIKFSRPQPKRTN